MVRMPRESRYVTKFLGITISAFTGDTHEYLRTKLLHLELNAITKCNANECLE